MKKYMYLLLVLTLTVSLISCSDLKRTVDQWVGKTNIELPKGQKLVGVTWRDYHNLCYLTRTMRSDETPETYHFHLNEVENIKEASDLRASRGTIITLIESR